MAKHKMFHLTARQDFGPYRRGDHIEDAAEVERILAGEHKVHVVKVYADPEPAAEAAPAEKPDAPVEAAAPSKDKK